ncbi:hypothetical protein GCM10027417_16010 [Glutamicibacter endophyticus]
MRRGGRGWILPPIAYGQWQEITRHDENAKFFSGLTAGCGDGGLGRLNVTGGSAREVSIHKAGVVASLQEHCQISDQSDIDDVDR